MLPTVTTLLWSYHKHCPGFGVALAPTRPSWCGRHRTGHQHLVVVWVKRGMYGLYPKPYLCRVPSPGCLPSKGRFSMGLHQSPGCFFKMLTTGSHHKPEASKTRNRKHTNRNLSNISAPTPNCTAGLQA